MVMLTLLCKCGVFSHHNLTSPYLKYQGLIYHGPISLLSTIAFFTEETFLEVRALKLSHQPFRR